MSVVTAANMLASNASSLGMRVVNAEALSKLSYAASIALMTCADAHSVVYASRKMKDAHTCNAHAA